MTTRHFLRKESGAALFLGGLLGAGTAFLLTPSSGRELRHKLADRASHAKDKTLYYANEGKDRVMSAVESGQHFIGDRKSLVTRSVAAGKQAYRKEKERMARGH